MERDREREKERERERELGFLRFPIIVQSYHDGVTPHTRDTTLHPVTLF